MKKFLVNLIAAIIFILLNTGALFFIGWFMELDIPIPVLIIGFCILIYVILRKEIEENG
jgi:hypothetical protein